MTNLGNLLKQAQAMQARVEELQARLAEAEVEGRAGGGLVTAVMDGKGELKRLRIDPSLASPDEVEVLEDLVVAACAEAKAKVEALSGEEVRKLTGGVPLPPGLKLF